MLTLSGCGSKNYCLEDTMLDKAFIATVDGEDCCLKISLDHDYGDNPEWNHKHYLDIISGEIYVDSSHCESRDVRKVNEIAGFENLTARMSPDEMQKAIDDELTIEDLMNILDREDQENQTEQEDQKVQTKTSSNK